MSETEVARAVCGECGQPLPELTEAEQENKRKIASCRNKFRDARDFVRGEELDGEITTSARDFYLGIIESLVPATSFPAELNAKAWEDAETALRQRAIDLHLSGDICRDGLDRFLEAAGLADY